MCAVSSAECRHRSFGVVTVLETRCSPSLLSHHAIAYNRLSWDLLIAEHPKESWVLEAPAPRFSFKYFFVHRQTCYSAHLDVAVLRPSAAESGLFPTRSGADPRPQHLEENTLHPPPLPPWQATVPGWGWSHLGRTAGLLVVPGPLQSLQCYTEAPGLYGDSTPTRASCRPPSGVTAVYRLPSAPPFALILGLPSPSQLAPRMARSWLCAHIVQNCLLSEIAVPCDSWGPAPGGSDDSGQRAPPPISGSVPCHPTDGVPWLHFLSLSGF